MTEQLLREVGDLIVATKDLDYDPSQEAWVCGDHGEPECTQGECSDLPWPEPNGSAVLAAFTDWAHGEFLREVRPYDDGRVPEMPDEAFRSYSVWEWPIGDFLTRATSPGVTES